ncbi:MAG: peroxiredoxin [Rhodospirillaceae bacterium]|nr:peroxiredoxin [Rhodospirillaceae bacterium]MCY4239526.1 peroxiredoxin [Rhodospirillaceae bacterium]MCY4310898.1 peroxiredoxin [Rhodospirillaceae bacterium]
MTVSVGDKIPSVKLKTMTAEGMSEIDTGDYFAGKKVVLFAVPGAFTPTCSARHLPGFVNKADALKGKGVDEIACISVNDAFVMDAWGKDQNAGGKVTMLADGNRDFTRAMGLERDESSFGLGTRSRRYALVAENGTITVLNVEQPGAFDVSSAEAVISAL